MDSLYSDYPIPQNTTGGGVWVLPGDTFYNTPAMLRSIGNRLSDNQRLHTKSPVDRLHKTRVSFPAEHEAQTLHQKHSTLSKQLRPGTTRPLLLLISRLRLNCGWALMVFCLSELRKSP